MAADSTLVNAAFKLGSARAGAENPNMKPLTDANTDISKGFMDVAQGAMNNYAKVKQVERAGLARQTQVFDSKVNKIIESIYEQEEPMHNGFVELYRGQIELLQEQFEKNNKFGKNDTVENNRERARIMGELSRIKNAAVGFRGKLGAFVEGQRVGGNKGEFNAANMDANNQALDFENYDELIEKGLIKLDYGKNGVEITSIINGQEFVVTLDSLKKDFPLTNLEHHGKVLAGVTQTKGRATTDANSVSASETYDEQEQIILYTRLVNTPENFQNLVSSQVDDVHMESTLKKSLETNLDVSKAILENMFVDGENKGVEFQKALDLDGDGDVDKDDLLEGGSLEGEKGKAFKQNVDALINVITNIDNPAFNIQYSSELLGKHLAAHDKKEYTDTFAKAKAANEKKSDKTLLAGEQWLNSGKSLPYRNGDRFMPYETAIKAHKSFEAAGKGEDTYFGWASDKFTFLKDTGRWTGGDIPEGGYSTKQLIDSLGIDNDAFAGFTNSTVVVVNESEIPKVSKEIMGLNWKEDKGDAVVAALESTYSDFPGFKFKYFAGLLRITHTESKVTDDFKMNKGKETRQGIRKFIQQNVNGKYILD
tara:strand:- start:136 stop:1920 length:1785 start_codon:yes stop_codon:yes gene_type:complete